MGERRIERRRFIRFDLDTNIKFRIFDDLHIEENIKTKAKNLSAEGVCIVTEKNFPVNKNIELEISLPGRKRPVKVRGKIIWSQKIKGGGKGIKDHYESGIRLFMIDKDDETSLLKYYCERMVDNLSQYIHF